MRALAQAVPLWLPSLCAAALPRAAGRASARRLRLLARPVIGGRGQIAA